MGTGRAGPGSNLEGPDLTRLKKKRNGPVWVENTGPLEEKERESRWRGSQKLKTSSQSCMMFDVAIMYLSIPRATTGKNHPNPLSTANANRYGGIGYSIRNSSTTLSSAHHKASPKIKRTRPDDDGSGRSEEDKCESGGEIKV
ncbi:hypothetical protein ACFX2I_005684 [Malus domestica]